MKIVSDNFLSFFRKQHTFLLVAVMLFQSCEIINPAEPIPSYVHIDSIFLSTSYVTEGSASSRFSDAWIYIDGDYLGTYEIPFTIPVLAEGSHKISVRAGILDNGISGRRAAYSQTNTYDTIVNLKSNVSNQISPGVKYLTGTVFSQIEDFDDGSLSLVATTSNTATLAITSASDTNAFEGNSGYVLMDTNHSFFEFASASPFTLPETVPVYVELNYKCSQEFTVGVIVNSPSGIIQSPVVNIRPTTVWKKIYINLSDGGGIFNGAYDYKIYLSSSLASGQSVAEIYLDNLKVLY